MIRFIQLPYRSRHEAQVSQPRFGPVVLVLSLVLLLQTGLLIWAMLR